MHCNVDIDIIVTGFWKTVPDHTFLFITATQTILHIQRYFTILASYMEFNAQITIIKQYSGNTYASIEIMLNTCRNTPDFMCDLELFSKSRSHIINGIT